MFFVVKAKRQLQKSTAPIGGGINAGLYVCNLNFSTFLTFIEATSPRFVQIVKISVKSKNGPYRA